MYMLMLYDGMTCRVSSYKYPQVTRKHNNTKHTCAVKAGTQIIDRAWRFMKDRISLNQHTRTGTLLLRNKIRSAQYQYWKRGSDLWLETGNLCTWVMQNFVHPM